MSSNTRAIEKTHISNLFTRFNYITYDNVLTRMDDINNIRSPPQN